MRYAVKPVQAQSKPYSEYSEAKSIPPSKVFRVCHSTYVTPTKSIPCRLFRTAAAAAAVARHRAAHSSPRLKSTAWVLMLLLLSQLLSRRTFVRLVALETPDSRRVLETPDSRRVLETPDSRRVLETWLLYR